MMCNRKIPESSSMNVYTLLEIWLIETYLKGMIGWDLTTR